MKQLTMLLALTLGAILTPAQAPAQTGPEGDMSDKASVSQCPRVTVSAAENPNARGKRRSYSATRSADLLFHLQFKGSLDNDHVVTLKVLTPNGHLYRQYDVPVASGRKKRSQGARTLPGYPYPVPVHAPLMKKARGQNFATVDVPFPVAGSSIVTSSLYGRWNLEVFLDGAADPCGRPTFFHLKE